MSTTLIVVASATPASVLGALAMLLPALRAREVARTERAYADKTFAAAESLADEVERTRNLPWYWPTGPAIEAAPAEHEAEVLHVDFPTSELRLADGLARLADEVGLVQALGCCTAHGDEPCAQDSGLVPPYCCDDCPDRTPALSDRPAADEDEFGDEQPGATLMRPVLAVARWVGYALALVDTVVDFVRTKVDDALRSWRERNQVGTGEAPHLVYDEAELSALGANGHELACLRAGQVPVFDRDTDAENNALYEAVGSSDGVRPWLWSWSSPPVVAADLDDSGQWARDAAITDGPDTAEPVNREPYRGRHWLKGTEHTGAWPVINRVPAQRTGDADV